MFYGLLFKDHSFTLEYNTLSKAKYYFENRYKENLDFSYKRSFEIWQKRQIGRDYKNAHLNDLFKDKFSPTNHFYYDFINDNNAYFETTIDLYYVQLYLAQLKHILEVLETNNIKYRIKEINGQRFNRMLIITSNKYLNDNVDSYKTLQDEGRQGVRNYSATELASTP